LLGNRLQEREGTSQKIAEEITTKVPAKISKIASGAPETLKDFSEGVFEQSAKQMTRKGKEIRPESKVSTPRAVITWLPEKREGYIGETRPAIGQMRSIDMSKVNEPVENPLKTKPATKPIQINGKGEGFAKMPTLKRPERRE
jgi:hypothetical protein